MRVQRAITSQRTTLLQRWKEVLESGVSTIGVDRPGGRRLSETAAFLEFMERELPSLMAKWHRERQYLVEVD